MRKHIFLWLFSMGFGMILSPTLCMAEEELYSAKGKRDPFVQLVATSSRLSAGGILGVESAEEILVEGIVVDADPKNSIVVANGSVLKESEEAGNVKVLKIDPAGVLFSVNGIESYKALYQEETKKNGGTA